MLYCWCCSSEERFGFYIHHCQQRGIHIESQHRLKVEWLSRNHGDTESFTRRPQRLRRILDFINCYCFQTAALHTFELRCAFLTIPLDNLESKTWSRNKGDWLMPSGEWRSEGALTIVSGPTQWIPFLR